jgi:biopolymer transport protein ExbB/TolQ
MKPTNPGAAETGRRPGTTAAAFLVGLPLAAAVLGVVLFGPLRDTVAYRYLSHPVECVEVVMFCCALGALAGKWRQTAVERRASATEVVPRWDGKPVPATEAPALLAGLSRLPRRLRGTYLARRVEGILDFLCQRRSAAGLDDHLRTLADNDVAAMEGSYALTRFITWAIPILGFLGTVLGITGAIAGVTPEKLEQGINSVTDGLALAFDATALALGLTMVVMFCSFLTERREAAALEEVDRVVDRELAHRFERPGVDSGPFVEALRQNARVLLDATQQLVQRQAEVWAKTVAEVESRAAGAQAKQAERVAAALEAALTRALQAHADRLGQVEKQAVAGTTRLLEDFGQVAVAVRDTGREQQAALARVAEGVAAQAAQLGRLTEAEKHLIQLQAALNQNLAALAGTGAFEQAVHSLTAAIHLLTARACVLAGPAPQPARGHPGKAA